MKKKTTKSDDRPVPEWDHEVSTAAWIGFCLFSFVVVLILLSNMPEIYAAIFNPEYWALMKILGRF